MGEVTTAASSAVRLRSRSASPPHSGIYVTPSAPPSKERESVSDRQVTIYIDGTDEAMTIGVKTSTTVQDVKESFGNLFQVDPKDIQFRVKTLSGTRTLRISDELVSQVYIYGIRSFRRQKAQYEHPILIVGAGLGAISNMINLTEAGRTDLVCMDQCSDFGGWSWIGVANKFTKLQTERGTYHADYVRPWSPVPREFSGVKYPTWPSRDILLFTMREDCKRYGFYKYAQFNCSVERVMKKRQGYFVQHVRVGESSEEDGEMTLVSAINAWPGFLHKLNEVDFPGEENFDGYIEYSSFDKVDYYQCTGKTTVLYGHGAFSIENVRTICEFRCKKVYVVCRTRNLCGTKMTSWLVGAMPRPLPASVLLQSFKRMYDLVGFDVWSAHSVTTDAQKTFAHIQQRTIFGVTDVYFLAGYYGLMECVVSEIKRISEGCVHTKKNQKIPCQVLIKATGTAPSFKVDKQFGIKECVGSWINGDPLRYICLGAKGVQARNFGSFSVGPGFAPQVRQADYFIDYPDDWKLVADKLPRNKAGQWPAFVTAATYGLPMGMALGQNLPELGAQMNEADGIKARKQYESHPLEEYLKECKAEWEAYIRFFRKHNMLDDRPDPPYPYTTDIMWDLYNTAESIGNGQKVSFANQQ